MLLEKKEIIGNYIVVFPLIQQKYSETYSVKNRMGEFHFLKLIFHDRLPSSYFNNEGDLNEIVILKKLHHPHISCYIDSWKEIVRGRPCTILITEFLSSESISFRLARTNHLSVYEIKNIIKSVLETLHYLHTQTDPIIYNGISLDNIMLDLSNSSISCVLTDFSQSCYISQDSCGLDIEQADSRLIAPERRDGIKTIQSDIYSIGIVMYQMLYGVMPPSNGKLQIPNVDRFELDDNFLKIIVKATQSDVSMRFKSAQEMIDAFDDDSLAEESIIVKSNQLTIQNNDTKLGKGFDGIAGMEDIKAKLRTNVINILRNQDRAKMYGISIPNGMLLYGPPGCGKSFFAEKFAEETGFFYKYIKASDLASIYIHGSQEKIGSLFNEARKNAPAILCFDEFDALVPKRNDVHNPYQAGEVNEFLSQLNNCGKDRIYVIATTNQPDMIDTAVLRKGRIDNIIYLPPPDYNARQDIFRMHLKYRPCESTINYEILANMTEHYVASDIAYVVNEAAICAFESMELISQKMLEDLILQCKPSLSRSSLKYYEDMRKIFEHADHSGSGIGFHL